MPIVADCHLHSDFSGDSNASMESMIQRAVSLGFSTLCFTEHMDLDYPVTSETPMGLFDLDTDSYQTCLRRLQEKYRGQLTLGFGVELGMQPQLNMQNTAYAKRYPFDFIIASTHLVESQDPYYPAYFEKQGDEGGYRAYFETELASMQSFTEYDVYGHIDYIVRYGQTKDKHYSYDKYRDLFERMIETLLERGKGIECNTGGLRKGLKEAHPCRSFLKRYRQKGGEIITVGSDAHCPADIGSHFDLARQILSDCGFKRYYTYQNRRPFSHSLT